MVETSPDEASSAGRRSRAEDSRVSSPEGSSSGSDESSDSEDPFDYFANRPQPTEEEVEAFQGLAKELFESRFKTSYGAADVEETNKVFNELMSENSKGYMWIQGFLLGTLTLIADLGGKRPEMLDFCIQSCLGIPRTMRCPFEDDHGSALIAFGSHARTYYREEPILKTSDESNESDGNLDSLNTSVESKESDGNLDNLKISADCSKSDGNMDDILETIKEKRRQRYEYIVHAAIYGRALGLGWGNDRHAELLAISVDLAIFSRYGWDTYEETEENAHHCGIGDFEPGDSLWCPTNFIGHCILLRACAKMVMDGIEDKESKLQAWKPRLLGIMSEENDDFGARVQAALLFENLYGTIENEPPDRLFDHRDWFL